MLTILELIVNITRGPTLSLKNPGISHASKIHNKNMTTTLETLEREQIVA